VSQTLALAPEWKEYEVRGVALADYAPGQLSLTFTWERGAATSRWPTCASSTPNSPAAAAGQSGATPQNPVALLQKRRFFRRLARGRAGLDRVRRARRCEIARAGTGF
jgi:hypothetical protein